MIFLDQKDLRQEIMKYAKGAKVLNLFSYSGAFGIYAMQGGAKSVNNVDSSDFALELCKKHAELNEKLQNLDQELIVELEKMTQEALNKMDEIDREALKSAEGEKKTIENKQYEEILAKLKKKLPKQ